MRGQVFMVHAVLTIDDVSSANTPAIVDYLTEKGITAVMFAVGKNVEKFYDNAIYALQKGMIIGNHSYSHPNFSEITIEEGIEEIEHNERVLDKLYKDAGVERKYRPFRFPYGNKGDKNKPALQKYLRDHGFSKLKDTQIPFAFWKEFGLDREIDTLWTFDFCEYLIRPQFKFTKESVFKRMDDMHPESLNPLFEEGGSHILLIHAHDETEEYVPGYFRLFIDHLLEKGVVVDKPEFI